MPWYVDTRVLFYRTDMIAKPPRTWSEWIATMEQVKRSSRDPHFYPLLMPTNEWPQPVVLAVQRGATLRHRRRPRRISPSREFVEAILVLPRHLHTRTRAGAGQQPGANIYQQFGAGDFAMFISGPWDVGNLRLRLRTRAAGQVEHRADARARRHTVSGQVALRRLEPGHLHTHGEEGGLLGADRVPLAARTSRSASTS